MDSTTEAEDLVIDPQLLAQLENLESQCNPDFDLGSMSGYLASFCSKNCSIVQKLCDWWTTKVAKTFAFTKKEATAIEGGYKHGTICFSGDGRDLHWGWKGSDTSEYEAV